MTALRATFHFRIRELLVEPELLGTSHEIEHGPYRMRLTLPNDTEKEQRDDTTWAELDARFPARDTFPLVERSADLLMSASVSMESIPEVTMVRVECFFEGAFGAGDFADADSPKVAPAFDTAFQALYDADHAAREALRLLLESIRVRGQHWLGPDSGSPRGIAHCELVDLGAGRRLPVEMRLEPDFAIKKIEASQVLDAPRMGDAVKRVQEG
jgi:hypothetical protein